MESSFRNTEMEEAYERLRAERESYQDVESDLGIKLGLEWGVTKARYSQLDRIDHDFFDAEWSVAEALAALSEAIGEDCRIRETVVNLFGVGNPSLTRIEGFIHGAAQIREEVDEK